MEKQQGTKKPGVFSRMRDRLRAARHRNEDFYFDPIELTTDANKIAQGSVDAAKAVFDKYDISSLGDNDFLKVTEQAIAAMDASTDKARLDAIHNHAYRSTVMRYAIEPELAQRLSPHLRLMAERTFLHRSQMKAEDMDFKSALKIASKDRINYKAIEEIIAMLKPRKLPYKEIMNVHIENVKRIIELLDRSIGRSEVKKDSINGELAHITLQLRYNLDI